MRPGFIHQLAFSIAVAVSLCSCSGERNVQPTVEDSLQLGIDSILFTPERIEISEGNCDQPEGTCMVVVMEYPVFSNEQPIGIVVNDWIKRQMAPADENGIVPDQKTYAEQMIEMFKEDRKTLGDEMMGWSVEYMAGIHFENTSLLSVYVSGSSYTGGAHPNSSTAYASFNKTTGKKLGITDIVTDSLKFSKTCESYFRKQNGFKPDTDLYEAGFEFGDDGFYINTNFYLTDRSVIFLYNNYEIGPYAIGSWSFSVPYGEILDQLKPEFKLLVGIPES